MFSPVTFLRNHRSLSSGITGHFPPESSVTFNGIRIEAGQRWVRQKSLKALRDKIRDRTKRTCGDSLASVVASLNPVLKGWFGYFQHAHHYTFSTIDGFVRRRLRAVMRRRFHWPGQGHNQRDHKQWPNACNR